MMIKLRDEEREFRLNLRKVRCHRRRGSLRHKWREKEITKNGEQVRKHPWKGNINNN